MSVETILALQDDALSNAYQVVFPAGIPLSSNSDRIALRLDQSFDPPDENITTYDIKYRGITVTKTARSEGTSKEFTIEVRIDQEWDVIKDLRFLQKMSYDPLTGTGMSDTMTRFPISIQALDGDFQVKATIAFKNCKLKGLKVNSFENEGEGPLRASLAFIYGTMDYEF